MSERLRDGVGPNVFQTSANFTHGVTVNDEDSLKSSESEELLRRSDCED